VQVGADECGGTLADDYRGDLLQLHEIGGGDEDVPAHPEQRLRPVRDDVPGICHQQERGFPRCVDALHLLGQEQGKARRVVEGGDDHGPALGLDGGPRDCDHDLVADRLAQWLQPVEELVDLGVHPRGDDVLLPPRAEHV